MLRLAVLGLLLASPLTRVDAGPVVCQPDARRCGSLEKKAQTVERCNETGTKWGLYMQCMGACRDGACFPPDPY